MLGHRGCRLGIVYPEITEMQVRAIMEAACELTKQKKKVFPEIMIPLVAHSHELREQMSVVRRVAADVFKRRKMEVPYQLGTMIELPRAALTADDIAGHAEFFSFGTNDLTQTTFGISRDDSAKFLPHYIREGMFDDEPFTTIDQKGVGELVRIGIEKGRSARKNLKIGICGEHGGDPLTIHFCHDLGIDYVSCSPFRVPIARLAAAQAVLRENEKGKARTGKRARAASRAPARSRAAAKSHSGKKSARPSGAKKAVKPSGAKKPVRKVKRR